MVRRAVGGSAGRSNRGRGGGGNSGGGSHGNSGSQEGEAASVYSFEFSSLKPGSGCIVSRASFFLPAYLTDIEPGDLA